MWTPCLRQSPVLTTTGASILSNVEALTHTSLMWRSFTHWVGGMGVLVFIMSFLPLMGGSTINLMKAESPGPSVSRLVPHVKDTAKILYRIYLVITIIEIVLLCIFGMPMFDSLTLTFGTVGTGGFGIHNDSIAGYSPVLQNIITVFMILSGVNYVAYFYIMTKQLKEILKWKKSGYILASFWVRVLLSHLISEACTAHLARHSVMHFSRWVPLSQPVDMRLQTLICGRRHPR